MILLTCKGRGDESLSELENAARAAFPHPDCAKYIDVITSRKNESARADSLFALSSLALLCDRIGADRTSLMLKREESGRPFFKDSSLDFSVSHSNGIVAVALSDTSRVGVDVEVSALSPDKAVSLAMRYFSRSEADAVKSGQFEGQKADLPDSVGAFRRIWTEKEALAKMSGVSLSKILSEGEKAAAFVRHLCFDGAPVTLCVSVDEQIEII